MSWIAVGASLKRAHHTAGTEAQAHGSWPSPLPRAPCSPKPHNCHAHAGNLESAGQKHQPGQDASPSSNAFVDQHESPGDMQRSPTGYSTGHIMGAASGQTTKSAAEERSTLPELQELGCMWTVRSQLSPPS